MVVVSGRDYRANLAKYYGMAHDGEDVVVRTRYGSWKVVPITEDDMIVNRNEITPELAVKIEKARRNFREGRCKELCTHEEIDNFFNSL